MSKKIFVTGLGPGLYEHMTEAAKASLEEADIICGYKTYIDIIADLIGDKEVHSSGLHAQGSGPLSRMPGFGQYG